MNRLLGGVGLGAALLCAAATPQVIEVQSNGLTYQSLARSGVTVMFTHLPGNLHKFAVVQTAVFNGSQGPYIIRPENYTFERSDGQVIHAVAARTVIEMLLQKGNGSDAVRLVTEYENSIYGNPQLKASNGYETRRQAAIATGGARVRSAVVASALALVQTKLAAGESTDGAVFFPTDGKPLGSGRLVVRTNTDVFQFNAE